MTQALQIASLLAGSYLLGSLPFGYWVALKVKGVDIRTVGSGNIGSTNVGRVCGPFAAGVVWILDVLKGLLPPVVGVALLLPSGWQILAALFAIVGHNYSVFLGFKGGKGIATSMGALLGIAPPVGAAVGLLWAALVLTLRYVSVASISAALALPFLMAYFYPGERARIAFALLACFMAVYKHRANLQRLANGTEPKIRVPWSKDAPTTAAVRTRDTEKDAPANAPR